jgi:exopolysaccharide biosynthesis polyprenyl glycosylphosphotransferase
MLADANATPAVRSRDRAFRGAVAFADVAAALTVAAMSSAWLPTSHLSWTVLVLPVLVPLMHLATGLYQRDMRVLNKNTLDEAPAILRAEAITTVVGYLLQSTVLSSPIGGTVVAFQWLGLTLSVLACRMLARAIARAALEPERCLVLGDHEHTRQVAGKLELGGAVGLKSELVGVFPVEAAAGRPKAGRPTALEETVRRLNVHRVLVAADTGSPQAELEAIQAAKSLGVKVSVLPRMLEVVGSSASYDCIDGLTVLGVPRFGITPAGEVFKRVSDVAASLLLLVVLSPVMLVMALAIKLDSKGPVLFRQVRIGRNGRAFRVFKFRSMQANAEAVKDALRTHNDADGLFKIAEDPRITRVGRLLRKTSLDELPQLLNVLRGEMSLVGPRPLVPDEDERIQGWYRRRLHLTPGMTGPWQILGSTRIPLQEMMTIDYLYVANWSLWNDVKIMLRTIGVVVARRGL